ncbi:hypothetical protein ADL00_45695 [Streptomyces sp. AS58]|uniref:WhiB family transcriptional regulator n=1 Tax=Streptomyces TaxID=1883 RepID=UPI0006BF8C3F|nr:MULTISPECIES: WhiB family transcriptional regulator [Streptomyces]KOV49511.1 hypothetical protein ADL00_45695 [Streptomyces sp. AS58]
MLPHFLVDLRVAVPCSSRPHLFYRPDEVTEGASSRGQSRTAEARELCATCPVTVACRNWARESGEYGIWGGETESERIAAGYACRVHADK